MVKLKKKRKSIKFSNKKKTNSNSINWNDASDVRKLSNSLLKKLELPNIDPKRIFYLRSKNANTRAIARIYGFSRVWQKVLDQKPAYVLEVISEKFDRLSEREKEKVILHEIAHIPSNFSGSLIPHIRRGKRSFYLKLRRFIENADNL